MDVAIYRISESGKKNTMQIIMNKKKEVVLNAKYLDMLGSCLRQFGEDVPFNAEILDNMGFDWKFSNEQIDVGGFLYDVIGEYAFAGVTINKIKKIKIIKINRYE
jgi:hypothetical protein